MGFNRWLLLLMLLEAGRGTLIKLNNGGFEDVVIAINRELPEDHRIVDNIKHMVEEASAYLFNATQQRFYFKTVKVVIPLTWGNKPEYKRGTIESYEKADVIVAEPFLKYEDDPYTLQFGGCGEQGRYIHFTSTFLTNDSLHDVYGSQGRVFVHEWAHLRWGVFDEYNNDAPFYATGINKAEATRCSADVKGKYIFQPSKGPIRECKVERRTGLYESGCQFVPEKQQSTPASIMYMQSLSSVTQFCNESNHNVKATNMQNKLCNQRSTWEVIRNSTDFASSSPLKAPPPAPTISLLQTRERVLCLVLDVSGSMDSYDRINRLRQAAELFLLQIIEMGSWVGIVTFSSSAIIRTGLQQITSDTVRRSLATYLPTSAGEGTNICSGIRSGFQVFLQKYPSTEGCEIVLLVAGEDPSVRSCFDEVEKSGSKIHAIALGPSAAPELDVLADMTGVIKIVHDLCRNNDNRLDFQKTILFVQSCIWNLELQNPAVVKLESKGQSISAGAWLDGVVSIDKTVGNDTFFVVTWSVSVYPPGILLTDPRGEKYIKEFVIENTNIRMARLKIRGTAEAGDWHYSIQNTNNGDQVISLTVTTRAPSLTEPPVTVKVYMNRDTNNYPNPIIVYAEVSQGFLPVIGASVTATIEPESGTAVEMELLDNGAGADILKNDGIYSRYFTSFKGNGRYNIKVNVQGKDKTVRRVRRQSHTAYTAGYVDNGVIKRNAPRPKASDDVIPANLGNFNRIASGGSFVMAGVPTSPKDVFPPVKITDLEVELVDDAEEFFLSWTAPGNDYDTGKVESYEIKMSENPLEFRDATFQSAISVNTSGLTPAVAGVRQSLQFKPENFTRENGTIIYFAIRAIDDSKNVGEVSNIARTALLVPPLPPTADSTSELNDTGHSNDTVYYIQEQCK
ncbi:calcium-activated chloride channel regulator 1-like [Hemicordylus capensis]|uniref:calcium-activated chloride channel regulator 1-like n=1 Tax=Hemicordylus capensis TaxID=884348 RepID=UPI002302DFD8|nr:calcium-activated chloride channel regulator 1-like [Hemicordylus capensis]